MKAKITNIIIKEMAVSIIQKTGSFFIKKIAFTARKHRF